MVTVLEFLKEITHLKLILNAEMAPNYPRRKLLKQWQTSDTSAHFLYLYSIRKQVKNPVSKDKATAIFLIVLSKLEKETFT